MMRLSIVAKETYYRGKNDLSVPLAKETYYRGKNDPHAQPPGACLSVAVYHLSQHHPFLL
jgi:hypothetical protein